MRNTDAVPLVFGDVSVLRYANGDEALGGHAFATAWHLEGLGRTPLLISRVGDDHAGDEVLRALQAWEVPTLGIQRADGESTACVEAGSAPATPDVAARARQPWHRIAADESLRASRVTRCGLIAHDSQCLLSATNRHALDGLVEDTGAPVYFDADGHAPFLEKQELARHMARSRWVSIQQADLPAIGAALGFAADTPEQLSEQLVETFDIAALFFDVGVNGASAVTRSLQRHAVLPAGTLNVIDRVGIAEAFSAVAIHGLLADWSVATILRRAQGFVELIAALPVPEIPTGALYDDVRKQWLDERAAPDDLPLRASVPIPDEVRLPAEIEKSAEKLDELKRRQESARMRAVAASESAAAGNAASSEALQRADRSLRRLEDRMQDAVRRLRALDRSAKLVRRARGDENDEH